MFLKSLILENFKGISERQRIELAPVTMLYGPNSGGKSTILHALIYLKEIIDRRNFDADQTLVGGEHLDLGGFENLLHRSGPEGMALNQRIGLGFEIQLDDPYPLPESEDFSRTRIELQMRDLWAHEMYLDQPSSGRARSALDHRLDADLWRSQIETLKVFIEIGYSSVCKYAVSANGIPLIEIETTPYGKTPFLTVYCHHPIFLSGNVADADSGESVTPSGESLFYQLLRAVGFGKKYFSPTEEDNDKLTLRNVPLEDLSDALPAPDFNVTVHPDNLEQHDYEQQGYAPFAIAHSTNELFSFLTSVIAGPLELLKRALDNLTYLGPIRTIPNRKHQFTRSPEPARWADGSAAWDVLATNKDVLDKTSHALYSETVLNTGYQLRNDNYLKLDSSVANTYDDNTGLIELLAPLHLNSDIFGHGQDIVLIDDNHSIRHITDVGVGFAQLIPFLAASAHAKLGGIVSIEQPELHVHPGLQSRLGDFLAWMLNETERGVLFLIETHSEHMLLRLLRRIREHTDDEVPPGYYGLTPDDIALSYAAHRNGVTSISRLRIDAEGEFIDKWPDGFFDERTEDLF